VTTPTTSPIMQLRTLFGTDEVVFCMIGGKE
jgi:hypothetical protein